MTLCCRKLEMENTNIVSLKQKRPVESLQIKFIHDWKVDQKIKWRNSDNDRDHFRSYIRLQSLITDGC